MKASLKKTTVGKNFDGILITAITTYCQKKRHLKKTAEEITAIFGQIAVINSTVFSIEGLSSAVLSSLKVI